LFIFVDFGPVANRFLSAYGSKSEPSINEVADILISDPKKFYELSGGYEKYAFSFVSLILSPSVGPSFLAELRCLLPA
jgi:Protein of unknown function (DUF3684)